MIPNLSTALLRSMRACDSRLCGRAAVGSRRSRAVGKAVPALVRGGVDDDGREYYVNGQPAKNGKLILTASNGFWNAGCLSGIRGVFTAENG